VEVSEQSCRWAAESQGRIHFHRGKLVANKSLEAFAYAL